MHTPGRYKAVSEQCSFALVSKELICWRGLSREIRDYLCNLNSSRLMKSSYVKISIKGGYLVALQKDFLKVFSDYRFIDT